MLIIFGGLSGTGKTTIARALALKLDAVHLRIDSIEQAIRNSKMKKSPVVDAGYLVAYAVALDNLRLGRTVIADSVNPIPQTRDAWLKVAKLANVKAFEVEVICSDAKKHRKRLETRVNDIPGSKPLTWKEVLSRDYRPWNRKHIVVDSAAKSIQEIIEMLHEVIVNAGQKRRKQS